MGKENSTEPEFTFLQALIMSFYSRRLYRDIFYKWSPSGLFYSLKLSIWLSLILVALAFFALSKANMDEDFRDFSNWLVGRTGTAKEKSINRAFTLISTLPHLEYANGKLSTPEPMTAIIHDPETKNAFLTINTTNKPVEIPYRHNTPYFTLTPDYFAINGQQIGISQMGSEQTIKNLLHVINNFPPLQLAQNRLIYTGEDPFTITKADGTDPLVIIDTSHKPPPLGTTSTAWLMLHADSIAFKTPFAMTTKIITARWEEISSDTVYNALKHGFTWFRYGLALFIILVLPIFIFILFAFQSACILLYSSFAFIYVTYVLKLPANNFSFQSCIKLCSVAFTPILVLCIFLPPVHSTLILIYAILGFGYIGYAIFSVLIPKTTSRS